MPGYLIFEIEITDPDLWADYQRIAGPVLAASGGRFLASDPAPEPLEGGWAPRSLSIVEFPSVEAARAFYHSPDYRATIPLRQRASAGRGVLVSGTLTGACPE